MDHCGDRLFRLALLLAGGGARIRRRVAQLEPGAALDRALAAAGAPASTLETAARLADGEARTVSEKVAASGWRWIIPGDAEYPQTLATISDPPLGLFVRGRLASGPGVAVVGSRKATPYGLQVARLLGEELGQEEIVVVSGMARGVDAAAHRGALASGGPTWAVWGTGPDRIYPPEHGELAAEIGAGGAILTEYPPGTPPRRHHFPERNRIIAGLARVVVVVEAAARSGALVTARLAVEEGREVLAVPGNIFSEASVGPNTLLRVGARPLLTPRDLFDAIGHAPRSAAGATIDDSTIVRFIGAGEALSADEISARAGVPVAEAAAELLEHELAGRIERRADGRFARIRAEVPSAPNGGSQ